MCRIVFWNLKRKDLTNLVCELAQTTETDVLVLNECAASIESTLRALKANVDRDFFLPNSNSLERFHCYSRNRDLDLTEVHKGFRTSYRRLVLGTKEALLGLVHGVDIRNYDQEARRALAQGLAEELRFVKSDKRNNRLIIMGDFNMNPYDPGMNLAMCLNAMMTKSCVARRHRTFAGIEYDFYYNPMWSLFGDGTNGPAGTVYNMSNQGPYGWSMLDQVILNHSIVDWFESVQILTHAGSICLADSQGRPDAANASDHFPILVKLIGANCE